VGNLQAKRDFTDVRDVVNAYWLALHHAEPGEAYNIASGSCITIQELLDRLLALSTVSIEVVQDPSRMRPSDVEILLGDASRFQHQTGWKPTISFDQTLADLLQYWRERV
ncbi:MAG: GDP-mannose 4,6-dehydratase, partial [Paenibacillus sp.]|nr:GDP-mannose 4,6-dehydratase [Paenibacillus sp.]